MKGFDPKFNNFPEYINGITYEIWEEGLSEEKLHKYYASDILVRSPSSIIIGNEGVIAATKDTLSEFPDRKLFGEDVIWSGSLKRVCYPLIEFYLQLPIQVTVSSLKQPLIN